MSRLLDDTASDAVYAKHVRPELFGGVRRASAPRLVIVGGQPGCGKTGAVLQAAAELATAGHGTSIINGDELRALHPAYRRLVEEDRSTAADKTGADVGRWVEKGIREAALSGFNAVIETTMRQPIVVAGTMEAFKQTGHVPELRVLVVHPEVSGQAIYTRFANALHSKDTLPRFTLASYHEAAFESMPRTLQAVHSLGASISFLNRAGERLYASTEKSADPVKELARLRAVPLSEEQIRRIAAEWRRLVDVLDRPGVPQLVRDGVRANQARFIEVVAREAANPQRDKQIRDGGGPER